MRIISFILFEKHCLKFDIAAHEQTTQDGGLCGQDTISSLKKKTFSYMVISMLFRGLMALFSAMVVPKQKTTTELM